MQSQVVFYVDMQGKGKGPLPLHSLPKTNNNRKTKSNNKTKTKNKIKVVYTEDLTHPGAGLERGSTRALASPSERLAVTKEGPLVDHWSFFSSSRLAVPARWRRSLR